MAVPSLIVKKTETDALGKVFHLDKRHIIIGRRTTDYRPDIELTDTVISRRHAEILVKDDKYLLRDLGSTNGTMLHDDRILPGVLYELVHGSKIGFGIEGDSACVVLVFKGSDSTSVIKKRKPAPATLDDAGIKWMRIDEARKEVWVDSRKVDFSRKQYAILVLLYCNAGRVCSRDEIIEAAWPEVREPGTISDAQVDQFIHRLREKIEPDPSRPGRLVSKKAFGYMLV